MSQSHGIKGGTTGEVFQEQGFLLEKGDSVGADFFFSTFKIIYVHKNIYSTVNMREKFLCEWLIMTCATNYASCYYLDNIQLLQCLTVATLQHF